MPLSTEFALHDPFDLLDTAVVLQNIVATPAATVINYSLSVSSVIKPFVVVLEVRRFRRHRRSFRLRFLRRPPLYFSDLFAVTVLDVIAVLVVAVINSFSSLITYV